MTIWVIEERWWRDNDYGGDWEDEPNLDFGYFTDFDAAQEFADSKNGDRRGAYDEYVKGYAKAMKRYNALVAAGFTDERRPDRPVAEKILTYERWEKLNARTWTTYSPIEVEEHT